MCPVTSVCPVTSAGAKAIEHSEFDLLAIGRPFIANPDYITRAKKGEALKVYQDSMLTELY